MFSVQCQSVNRWHAHSQDKIQAIETILPRTAPKDSDDTYSLLDYLE